TVGYTVRPQELAGLVDGHGPVGGDDPAAGRVMVDRGHLEPRLARSRVTVPRIAPRTAIADLVADVRPVVDQPSVTGVLRVQRARVGEESGEDMVGPGVEELVANLPPDLDPGRLNGVARIEPFRRMWKLLMESPVHLGVQLLPRRKRHPCPQSTSDSRIW